MLRLPLTSLVSRAARWQAQHGPLRVLSLARSPAVTLSAASVSAPVRSLASSAPVHAETTRLTSSAGSGRGGKRDKEAAAKRKDKEQQRKERERAKRLRDKERKLKLKQREQERKAKLKTKKPAAPRTRSLLTPPKAPSNAWGIFLRDYVKSKKESLPAGEKMPLATALAKEAAPLYRELAPSERHELLQRAEEERKAYPEILRKWQETLTPEMIKEENAIRTRRRKLGLSKRKAIKLEGEPKKPLTGYMRFSNDIRAQGVDSDVLKGETSVIEQSKLMAAAWRALSDSERQQYHDQYAADRERYLEEKKRFDEEMASRSRD